MKRCLAIFILGVGLSLSGCGKTLLFDPKFAFEEFPPPGPPNYQQGMLDGCKSALSAAANSVVGILYKGIYYDVQKALNDKVYYQAWKDGFYYCKFDYDIGPE